MVVGTKASGMRMSFDVFLDAPMKKGSSVFVSLEPARD